MLESRWAAAVDTVGGNVLGTLLREHEVSRLRHGVRPGRRNRCAD